MEDLTISINGKSKTNTLYEGKARKFNMVVDEPENFGGKDSAPTPAEYILAGYAGCLNVVVNLIAKEMGIIIKNLEINISGNINPEKLLGISDKERAGFKSITAHLNIDSNASEAKLKELIEQVKERCPVNDNLANPTPVSFLM